jgi:GNAT superfamily N-acetyltransferase
MSIRIRDFQQEDISELAGLMRQLGYPTTASEMQERMHHISQQGEGYKTIIAVHDDEIAGMIGAAKIWCWEQNGFYIKIQALVVNQSFRNIGVGALLINACEEWARQTGAVLMALTCGNKEERKAAHLFYPRMGFEHKSSGYIKQL